MNDWNPNANASHKSCDTESNMNEEKQRDILKVRTFIARSLRSIEELALDLHAQALASPNARDFPGGDALHMLAPAIARQDWDNRYAEAEEASYAEGKPLEGWNDPLTYQGDTESQPLNVLATWVRMVREDRNQPTYMAPTLSSEAGYLHGSIDWMCRIDAWGEPEWPLCFELAKELNTLVRRMEDVLHDGIRKDLGADCLDCNRKLIKVWGIDAGTDWHFCEICGKKYNRDEYAQALKASYLANAQWLTSEDMATAWRIPRGSISSWASGDEPRVRKKRDIIRGRVVYNVEDAKRERDRRDAKEAQHGAATA